MNNLWKRSLSLLLALVMVLGMFPMGTRVKAANAGSPLNEADGIIWLVKNGDDASEEFVNKITGLKLDDMIRAAVGNTTGAVVEYNGINVGTYAGLAMGGQDLKDDLVAAVSKHQLVAFTVGGVQKWIAFRSIDGVSIVVGENNQIVIESAGRPDNLDELVNNALANPQITISHNGVADLSKTDHIVSTSKKSYSWPEPGEGDVVAGSVTVTIYADDKESEKKSVTADVILRDSRKVLTLEYYDHLQSELLGSYVIYADQDSPMADPKRDYYTFGGWSEFSKDDESGLYQYKATWTPVYDDDEDGVANEDEYFTITYMVGGEVFYTESVRYGSYTPVPPANPGDTESGKFAGWGTVAQRVYADATYTAVFTQRPIVTVTVRYQSSTRSYMFYVKEDGTAQNPPSFGAIEPYYCTGLYYTDANGNVQSVQNITSFNFTENGVSELKIDYYTDTDNNKLEDGTAANPYYVYKFVDINGEGIETYKQLTKGVAAEKIPAYDPLNWIFKSWNYGEPVATNNGGTITYTVTPELIPDNNNNDIADEDENDKLVLNLDTNLFQVTYQPGKAVVTHVSGGKTYIGTISITGLMTDGSFTYNPATTEIVATPLWLNGDPTTGVMLYYVDSLTVGEEDPGVFYQDFNACKVKSETAVMAEQAEGVKINVKYVPAVMKTRGDDDAYLAPGLPSYSEQEVYAEAIKAPAYDAAAVTVEYLARSAGSVTVNLKNLYNSLADLIPEDYMEMAKEYVGESITVSLEEKWLEVEAAPAREESAQAVADAFFQSVIDEINATGFNQDVMSDKIFTLKDELKAKLEASANVHKFGVVYPDGDPLTPDVVVESVNVTYQTEKIYLNKDGVEIFILDTRTPVVLEAKGDLNYGYRCFTEADLLKNIVVKNAETGNVISGLELILDGAYGNAGVGSHIVGVSFAGNETYSSAATSFKLTVNAVKPVVTIPSKMVQVLNGVIDYDQHLAASVTPSSAPIFHVIAGLETEELAFDSNLVFKDEEIVLKAWVKIPAMYASLINGMEVEGKTIKIGEFMNITELEDMLDEYASNPSNMGANEIKKVQGIIDMIPERIINRLGLEDRTYTLQVRLDSLDTKYGPTKPGMYVNFAASTAYLGEYLPGEYGSLFKNNNYLLSDQAMAAGMVVIYPMVPIANSNGVQIYDNKISNAQNVFVYEYNGQPVDVSLEVAYNGEKLEGAVPFYYGVSTRMDLKESAPTMPGVYMAGYNHFITVLNENTNEEEIRRLGSDSCVIVIKQRNADMTITGGIFEETGSNILPEIKITDKHGNVIKDSGMTIISGTANVELAGTNVTADDLYGTINIDFPDALQAKWDAYCIEKWGTAAPANVCASDVIAFLEVCGNKAADNGNKAIDKFQEMGIAEAVNAVLAKLGQETVDIDGKVEQAQNLLNDGKAYYDKLIDELRPLATTDNNLYVTFYDLATESDKLPYYKTGVYLYMGVITDPDLTIDAAKGFVIIHSAEDYIMYDTHVPYDGQEHNIFTVDESNRDEVVVVMDRADDSYVAVSRDNKEVHFQVDEAMAQVLIDEFNAICNTSYTGESGFYVGTVYEKTGNFAERVTNKIMAEVKTRGAAEIAKYYPAGTDLYNKAIEKLTAKLVNLETKLLGKLQQFDTLDNGTKICINAVLPVDLGAYEVTTLDFNVNEINIILDGDTLGAINAALTKAGFSTISNGADGYVITGYEKAEDVAKIITDAVISRMKAYGSMVIYKIDGMLPDDFEKLTPDQLMNLIPDELKDLTADKINAETQEKLDALNAKLAVFESRLSAKLQSIDNLDNYTRIVINGKLPVEVGTYDFFGYDYDVSATRGVLVIEPIYILVEDDNNSKYYGEEDPDLTATVSYYSYSGNSLEGIKKVEITTLPNGKTEADLVSYNVTRNEGEDIGLYDMTVHATLLDNTGRYKMADREEDTQDFEILPEIGTIGLGKWTMDLDSVVYMHYYPELEGFSPGFDFATRGGVVIWTGDTAVTSRDQVMAGKPNTMIIEGMRWNEDRQAWYVRTHEIYAKNLGDIVYIRPYVLDNEGNYVYLDGVPYYSPARFSYDVMNALTEPENKRYVCAALLQYGASAQTYFGYETDNLVTTIPTKYQNIKMSDYDLEYKASYLNKVVINDHVKALALTLGTDGENYKTGVSYNKSTLNLVGAIRFATGFNIDTSIIDLGENMENVAKAEVLFWNERDFANVDSIAYKHHNYSYKCDLTKATGKETVYIGDYRGQSGHIVAKYLGESVYFTCRIELKDGSVYNSGLAYYSPEAFAGDHIKYSTGNIVDLSKSIVVYSEMAYNLFILGK